ncbi:antitoxin VbhA family protein [Dyella jejuensis]|uniref:Antitoxin VbhA family protein n=1 Tax=Dyella jejuensis TaxID=1432009 RepID=A0ABW8JPY1_9GAMM
MIDEQTKSERRRAVANAIATVRLEGLDIDPVTAEDLHRHARGEIELDEVLRHLRERVAAGAFRDPVAAL